MGKSVLEISCRGAFYLSMECGTKVHLTGVRERAIFALLAHSPGHTRTRTWIADKLWSTRPQNNARASLRQSLRSLKKAFGSSYDQYLSADRSKIALVCKINIVTDPQFAKEELYEDIDIPDPEFEEWLRDLRLSYQKPAAPQHVTTSPRKEEIHVGLEQVGAFSTKEEDLVARTLLESVGAMLKETGAIQPVFVTDPDARQPSLDAFVQVSGICTDGQWYASVRVTPRNKSHYAWSGRLRLDMNLSAIWEGPEIAAFATQIREGVHKTLAQNIPNSSGLLLSRASQMLFSGSKARIAEAEELLGTITGDNALPSSMAWRAYAAMTRSIEFGDVTQQDKDDAQALIAEAIARDPSSPTVRGLGAIVFLKLIQDHEFGHHLAREAMVLDDHNVFALDALSQSLVFQGDFKHSYHLSKWAQQAARHTQISYNWDMRCALSALSNGNINKAKALAYQSHIKAPQYKPALRYLYALNRITNDTEKALKYSNLLAQAEPGFVASDMLKPDYPIETLRLLGYDTKL